MRQILGTSNGAVVARMPRPTVERGSVLVRVHFSFISAGTELAPLRNTIVAPEASTAAKIEAYTNLSKKYINAALKNPAAAFHFAARIAKQKLEQIAPAPPVTEAGSPRIAGDMDDQGWNLGYSVAGEVVEVGAGVNDFVPGDRVACSGAGQANHADYVCVKRNLVCRIPDGCAMSAAASATIGSIALQGVRRAQPQLGDRVAVLGLGLIGQLTVQLLRAAGCTVVGLGLEQARVDRALGLGMSAGATTPDGFKGLVRDVTRGMGADRTLVTAATRSDAVVNLAMDVT